MPGALALSPDRQYIYGTFANAWPGPVLNHAVHVLRRGPAYSLLCGSVDTLAYKEDYSPVAFSRYTGYCTGPNVPKLCPLFAEGSESCEEDEDYDDPLCVSNCHLLDGRFYGADGTTILRAAPEPDMGFHFFERPLISPHHDHSIEASKIRETKYELGLNSGHVVAALSPLGIPNMPFGSGGELKPPCLRVWFGI